MTRPTASPYRADYPFCVTALTYEYVGPMGLTVKNPTTYV